MRTALSCMAFGLVLIGSSAHPSSTSAEGELVDEGPGSPIVVVHDVVPPGEKVDALSCTLTAIGHDSAGRLVGLTAGHCARIGTVVYAEDRPDAGPIGRIVKAHHDMSHPPIGDDEHQWTEDLDFAVVEFDSEKISPSAQVRVGDDDVTITSVGGEPQNGDRVCATGRTSGTACGDVTSVHDWMHTASFCVREGDSGSPVIVGDRIVGLVTMSLTTDGVPTCGSEFGSNIDAVLQAIGPGVGDGFRAITG